MFREISAPTPSIPEKSNFSRREPLTFLHDRQCERSANPQCAGCAPGHSPPGAAAHVDIHENHAGQTGCVVTIVFARGLHRRAALRQRFMFVMQSSTRSQLPKPIRIETRRQRRFCSSGRGIARILSRSLAAHYSAPHHVHTIDRREVAFSVFLRCMSRERNGSVFQNLPDQPFSLAQAQAGRQRSQGRGRAPSRIIVMNNMS